MVQSVVGGCKLDPKFGVQLNTPQDRAEEEQWRVLKQMVQSVQHFDAASPV